LLVLALVACSGTAHAGAPDSLISDKWTSVQWLPQPVRHPVVPAQVQPDAPHVPDDVPTVEGEIEIGPDRASALWLDALDVLRVRSVAPGAASQGASTDASSEPVQSGTIILQRVIGAAPDAAKRVRGEIEESAVATAPGVWYIAQPPARGDVWLISASAPMRVVIERPVWRDDARLWEQIRTAVLQWIEHGGVMPELPGGPDSTALELGLRADHALAQILVQRRPTAHRFHQAVRDWRSASALTRLAVVGARRQPHHWSEERTAALAAAAPGSTQLALAPDTRPYARIDRNELVWSPVIEGPGVLELDVRALVSAPASSENDMGTLRIGANGRILAEHHFRRRPARVPAPGQSLHAPFPREVELSTVDGTFAGLRERVRVPLLPGKHTYTVMLHGGPSLARARIVRRRPLFLEVLRQRANPGDFVAAAEAGLAGDDAPEARLLALLLADLRGNPARADGPPSGLSPLLALVAEIVRYRSREVDLAKPDGPAPHALRALVEQAGPVLVHAGPDIDPALLWLLRRDLAELAAEAGGPAADALVVLTRDANDLPPLIAAQLAEIVASTPSNRTTAEAHAWALIAAQRAWRAEPLDLGIRRAYTRVWRRDASWSRLERMRPGTGAAPLAIPELPGHRFIERISEDIESPGSEDSSTGSAAHDDPRALWPIALGQRQRVLAPPSPVDPRRPMLLRAYVAMPPQASGSIQLRVDDQSFATLALAPVQMLEVAVPPGAH
jgi:hypothetical protein